VVDPTFLFDDPTYLEVGNLFWPDVMPVGTFVFTDIESVYEMLGKAPPPRSRTLQGVDSGQFLIDKRRHTDVLEWLWLLNSDPEFLDYFLQGDKDTFRLAFSAADKPFALVSTPARGALVAAEQVRFSPYHPAHAGYQGPGWRLVGMVQSHPTHSAPLFVHRTQSKLTMYTGYAKLTNITSPLPRAFMLKHYSSEDR
jgi:hypothetical protein